MAAVMEEDDFDKYEIDEEFKRVFWNVDKQPTPTTNGCNDDQDLRHWLKSLLEDEDLDRHKDVVFIVGEKGEETTVRAHRLILTTRSRTFANIIEEDHDPSNSVKISGVDSAVFQTIVHYVYTGKIEAPKHVLQTVDLMQAAAKYDIVPLHSVIKEFLQKRLPKLRIKHFIMITQRVLDLNVTELEQECFTLVESRTDQVVQDPMFLRVSSTFIARLLELDNFSGISEAAVFARVMEWATLRSGGSILPFHADRSLLSDDPNHLQEAGFHLTRPDVRSVLEAFIRSFRLTSVPKDDLAGLVKNSGVFTEHEQLVVSYYLLDQTKNLEDFCMKPRGTKIGSKRAENTRSGQTLAKQTPLTAPAPPKPLHTASHATVPAQTDPYASLYNMEKKSERTISPSAPPAQEVTRYSTLRSDSPTEAKQMHRHVEQNHNPDFSMQSIVKSTPPPPPSPKLVDKIRQKFTSDKTKSDGKDAKPKKDKDKARTNKERKVKKTPSGRVIQTAEVKDTSSSTSSSSSAASSRSHSPTAMSRRSINVDRESKDDTALLDAVKKSNKSNGSKRPKSIADGELVDNPREFKDVASGSVGKKGGIRSGLSGLLTRNKKWSPDHPRTNKESAKPAPPPRVKSVNDLSSKRDIVADI